MSKELLIETRNITRRPRSITENKQRGLNLFIEIVLATVEERNGNGRYYSKELWEREINNFQKKIAQNSTETVGELDHPDSQIINLKNGSHAIRKIWWEGNDIVGLIEVFCDPGIYGNESGRIAGSYLNNGLTVGISSRGMGSLMEVEGIMEVQDDFELLTWDFVSNPSNQNSWSKPIHSLNESKSVIKENKYTKVNSILTEILCSKGSCPVL